MAGVMRGGARRRGDGQLPDVRGKQAAGAVRGERPAPRPAGKF